MRLPVTGGFLFILSLAVSGCFAPVTLPEAQQIATARLTKYCNGHCGTFTLAGTQKIKNRWLVEFEAPRQKFTVMVETDGNTKVTAWDKSQDAAGR